MEWTTQTPITTSLLAPDANRGATIGDINTQQVTVIIAPSSFNGSAAPTVTVSNPPKPPAMDGNAGIPIGAPVSISIGDAPVRLNNLMQVTIKFDKSQLPAGTTADEIWATFYNGQEWEVFPPDSVNLQAGTVTFSSGHMTLFGAAKITVDEYIEKKIHSKVVAEFAQKEIVDEIVNQLAEKAIDNVLKDRLGLKEDSTKFKILSSALKDDEWADIASQIKTVYSNGAHQVQTDEVTQLVQTLNTFVGKKLVENIDEGTLEAALKRIPGSGDEASKGYENVVDWTKAGSEAAAYLAEKNYREAARIIGGKIADDYKLVKIVKATAEIIDYRINVWKNSEVEAAFKAYRNGASAKSAYGYDVDKGDFNALWDQMRAIGEKLQHDAVEAEKAGRLAGGQAAPSAREEEIIRAKVRTNLEAEFKARAAREDMAASEEAELKKLMAVMKEKGLFDDASGYRYGNDILEFRMDAVLKMRDKILRDTRGKKLTNNDIADLTQSYFSGTFKEGEAAYLALLKKRFGIDLAKASPTPPAVASTGTEALIQSRDKSQTFGTPNNPFTVSLGGTIKGDTGLKYEGVTYSSYAGLMNTKVTTFLYSIPADAKKTTLDFENVTVKYGNPKTGTINKSIPRSGGTPSQENTFVWLGWGEGKWSAGPIKNSPNAQLPSGWWTNGPSWTNGAPVSGKDVVSVDVGENTPWEQAGGAEFNLYWSMDFTTIWGPPQGKETQLDPSKTVSKGVEIVVIRLIKR